MAAFVNLPADPSSWNIIQIRSQCLITYEDTLTKLLINVFNYHKASSSGNPSLLGLANFFAAQVMAYLTPVLNVRVTEPKCFARPLDDPLVPEVENTTSISAGAVTGDPLSAALAVTMQLNTGVRGRSFMGRKHFGGLSESDTDGGDELKASVITSWGTVAGTLEVQADDGLGNLYNPCVLSSTLSLVFGTPPIFTGADITEVVLNPILGTMRRRKEKVPS